MTSPSDLERRAAPRVDCNLPAEVELDGDTQEAHVLDLSVTGARVRLSTPLALGSGVHITLPLPSGDDVSCSGLVRWTGGDGMVGLEFHGLHGEGRKALADFLLERVAPTQEQRRRWQGDLGTTALVSPGSELRWALRWHLNLPALAAEVLAELPDRTFVFVPGPSSDLEVGQTIWFELEIPFGHIVFRVAAEVVWTQSGGEGPDGPGVTLRLPGWTALDRSLMTAAIAALG